jgi:hypothetical protein
MDTERGIIQHDPYTLSLPLISHTRAPSQILTSKIPFFTQGKLARLCTNSLPPPRRSIQPLEAEGWVVEQGAARGR